MLVFIICADGTAHASVGFLEENIPEYMAKDRKRRLELDLSSHSVESVKNATLHVAITAEDLSAAAELGVKVEWIGTVENACRDIDLFARVVGFDELIGQISGELVANGTEFAEKYAGMLPTAANYVGPHTMDILHAMAILDTIIGNPARD